MQHVRRARDGRRRPPAMGEEVPLVPGPAPSKNPRRRNARPDWRVLPAAGREGPTPPWPLRGRTTKTLRELWDELWHTPQAVAWEALGWNRTLGRYAKLLLLAEDSDAPTGLLAEVRQLEDRLGLTSMAMKRLQWEIGPHQITDDDAEPDGGGDEPATVTKIDDYRHLVGS